jgi:hypothetical protein
MFIQEDARRRAKSESYRYSHHYRFFNIPDLNEQGLKTLYTEFKDGKKPADIISQHGFHTEVIEMEYQRFFRLNQDEIIGSFQMQILEHMSFVENPYVIEKLRNEGHLSLKEFKQLIELMMTQKVELRKKLQRKMNELDKK